MRLRPVIFLPILLASASFSDVHFYGEVSRYGHNVLGDTPEWSELCIDGECHTLPSDSIFEDIAPREVDLDHDGIKEVIVVESQFEGGASLAIYNREGKKITATPHIGLRNRWLAPVGAIDIDNDGHIEIAYVEKPHLDKTLRIWRYEDDTLHEIFRAKGFSNHAIGQNFITSAMRDCADDRAFLVPSADRASLFAVHVDEVGEYQIENLGALVEGKLEEAASCE